MEHNTNIESSIRAGKLIPGMSFNQKIWALTAQIPRGTVTTYAELARAVGTKAYRAVGNAMNKNPYAPGVPCHRVVGSDGRLTGYAFGLDQKKKMLEEEGVVCRGNRVAIMEPHLFS